VSVRKREWTTSKGKGRQAWVVDYFDQGGTRRLKTFTKKRDADAFAATTHVEVRAGTHVADSATITVAEAGKLWLASCEAEGLERSTLQQYRQHLDLHIAPFIGREKLSRLTMPAVRAFQDRLREEGRSADMVSRVTVSLGSILSDAQARGLVVRNPVREMGRQKRKRGGARQERQLEVGVDIPTPGDIAALIANLSGRHRPLLLTAIFTGLRASELRGLRWSDVDLAGARLHVRQRADRFLEIGAPKSAAARRTVPLPPLVVNTLREWKLACPKGDLGLVFPGTAGGIDRHTYIVERGLKPAAVAAGLVGADGRPRYAGLHCLRHFYASWCINPPPQGLGLPPKAVQQRLGHTSITMTMDRYGHLFPSADDNDALAAAEQRLLSAVNAT
jgi:integrase